MSFDDRGDFYGDPVVFSYVDLYNGAPGWRKTLDGGRFDSAILDTYLPLGQLLGLLPRLEDRLPRQEDGSSSGEHRATRPTPAPSPSGIFSI